MKSITFGFGILIGILIGIVITTVVMTAPLVMFGEYQDYQYAKQQHYINVLMHQVGKVTIDRANQRVDEANDVIEKAMDCKDYYLEQARIRREETKMLEVIIKAYERRVQEHDRPCEGY